MPNGVIVVSTILFAHLFPIQPIVNQSAEWKLPNIHIKFGATLPSQLTTFAWSDKPQTAELTASCHDARALMKLLLSATLPEHLLPLPRSAKTTCPCDLCRQPLPGRTNLKPPNSSLKAC